MLARRSDRIIGLIERAGWIHDGSAPAAAGPGAANLVDAIATSGKGADPISLRRHVERAVATAPSAGVAAALFHLGIREGNFLAALAAWRAADKGAERPDALVRHAETLFAAVTGDLAGVEQGLMRLSSLRSDAIRKVAAEIWLASGLPRRAAACLTGLPPEPPLGPWETVLRVRALLADGNTEEARTTLSMPLSSADVSPEVISAHASLLLQVSAFEEAEAMLRAAANGDGAGPVHLVLARLLLWKAQWREADLHAARAEGIEGLAAEASRIRGAVAAVEGRTGDALAALDRALELAPRDPEATNWQAETCRRLGHRRRALDRVNAANELDESFTTNVLKATLHARSILGSRRGREGGPHGRSPLSVEPGQHRLRLPRRTAAAAGAARRSDPRSRDLPASPTRPRGRVDQSGSRPVGSSPGRRCPRCCAASREPRPRPAVARGFVPPHRSDELARRSDSPAAAGPGDATRKSVFADHDLLPAGR